MRANQEANFLNCTIQGPVNVTQTTKSSNQRFSLRLPSKTTTSLLALFLGLAAVLGKNLWKGFTSPTRAFEQTHVAEPMLIIPEAQVHLGPMKGRADPSVVDVPAVVFNPNHEPIYDLELDMLFSDGTGRRGSLSDYFDNIKAPRIHLEVLDPRSPWTIPSQGISADLRDRYTSGQPFRIKLQLTWHDWQGKRHRSLTLGSLQYVQPREGYPDAFWFRTMASYSDVRQAHQLEQYWGLDSPFE